MDMAQTWINAKGFAEVVTLTLEYRAASNPDAVGFDFAASGDTQADSDDCARAKVAAFEAAGATWWMEWLDDRAGSYAASLGHIRRGPAGAR